MRAPTAHHSLMVRHVRCHGHHAPEDPAVHTHPSLALHLTDGGHFHMGSTWLPKAGDVLVVPDGMPHHRQQGDGAEMLGLAVCLSCMPDARWGPGLRAVVQRVRRGGCPVLRPSPADAERLRCALEALADELAGSATGRAIAIDGWMGVITSLVLRSTPAEKVLPAAETPLVARALEWTAAHARGPISLVDVARAVGRSPNHLAARIRAETGHPVGHWIRSARMAVARDLLLHSDENVDQLAERVGYRSPSHFHRVFREVHGLTPDGWRKTHQSGGGR